MIPVPWYRLNPRGSLIAMRYAIIVMVATASLAYGADWHDQVGPGAAPEAIAPIQAPFDMPQLQRPRFPDSVFPIIQFGAQPGGRVKNTEAINAAIAAWFRCRRRNGGGPRRRLVDRGNPSEEQRQPATSGRAPSFASRTILWTIFPSCSPAGPGSSATTIRPSSTPGTAATSPSPGRGPSTATAVPGGLWEERQLDTALRMYQEQILKDVPPEKRIYGTPKDGVASAVHQPNQLLQRPP